MEKANDSNATAAGATPQFKGSEPSLSDDTIQKKQKQGIVDSFSEMLTESLNMIVANLKRKAAPPIPAVAVSFMQQCSLLYAMSRSAASNPYTPIITKHLSNMVETFNPTDTYALEVFVKNEDADSFLIYFFEHQGKEKLTDLAMHIFQEAVPNASKDLLATSVQQALDILIKGSAPALGASS